MAVTVDHMTLTGVDVEPVNVQPGASVSVTATVTEELGYVGKDPDLCNPGGLSPTGQLVKVHVRPDWGPERTKSECIAMSNIGTGSESLTFDLPAPDRPGTHEIRVGISLPGSEQGPRFERATVEVSSAGWSDDDDPIQVDPDADDSGGGKDIPIPIPGSGGDGSGLLGNIQLVLLLIALIYGLKILGGD